MTIHYGARIELRVIVIGHRHRGERFLIDTVIVHETTGAQGDPLRWNIKAIGGGVRRRAGNIITHRRLPEAAELPLGEGAKDDAVFRESSVDGGRRIADGTGASATAAAPDHPGEAEMLQAERGRQPRRLVA